MPPYVYPASATALLSFSDLCVDPSSTNTVILADATQARSKFRNALKDVEAKNADWLIVLDVSRMHVYTECMLTMTRILPKPRRYRATYHTFWEPSTAWRRMISFRGTNLASAIGACLVRATTTCSPKSYPFIHSLPLEINRHPVVPGHIIPGKPSRIRLRTRHDPDLLRHGSQQPRIRYSSRPPVDQTRRPAGPPTHDVLRGRQA